MSIFGKKPEQPSPASTAASPAPRPKPIPAMPSDTTPGRSYLGAGCELTGDLTGEGSLECGGMFDGTIDISGDLVIGHGGTAKAELQARRISIEGRLHGNATGSEKVEVGASGHVEGDVRAPAVQFAEGAFFEGNVEMRRFKEADGVVDEGGTGDDDDAAAESSEGEDAG